MAQSQTEACVVLMLVADGSRNEDTLVPGPTATSGAKARHWQWDLPSQVPFPSFWFHGLGFAGPRLPGTGQAFLHSEGFSAAWLQRSRGILFTFVSLRPEISVEWRLPGSECLKADMAWVCASRGQPRSAYRTSRNWPRS